MNCLSNKCTYLYPRNNRDTIGIQQSIKNKIRYKSNPSGDAINLSKLSFSSDAFKLLNKNLKFVHTLKKYNKKQLDTYAENSFCFIKLQAHFKDNNPKSNTDQENLPFQIKNKQKWTPKDIHHNVSTFIALVRNYLNVEKGKKKKMKNPKQNSVYPKGNKKEWKNFPKETILLLPMQTKVVLVIMHVGKYINGANCQLSDK